MSGCTTWWRCARRDEVIRLGASQDARRKYRDSETDLEGSFYEGGTIQRQIKLECMTRMTKDRTRELRKLLNDESDR